MRARFSAHGRVAHVSLPTRQSGEAKVRRGFGFVEFEGRDDARRAIAALDGAAPRPGAAPTAVVSRLEWAATRKRWNDLCHNPVVAQARRRRRQGHDAPLKPRAAAAAADDPTAADPTAAAAAPRKRTKIGPPTTRRSKD